MNSLFTKIRSSLETRRTGKIIISSFAAVGLSICAIAFSANHKPAESEVDPLESPVTVEEDSIVETGATRIENLRFRAPSMSVTQTSTVSEASVTTTATIATTIATTTPSTIASSQLEAQPTSVVVTPTTENGNVTTVTETSTSSINNDTIDTTDGTTVEVTTVTTTIESTTATTVTTVETQVVEPTDFVVYKPSTHYCHRNTCHWYTDECYEITTTEGLECRICTECNPDIVVITPYVEPTSSNGIDNTLEHYALNFVTEEERIYLCNTVAQEYGSDWVSQYDKALVVATVMNRVRDGGWTNGLPSTVYNVLTAPNQYDPGYAVPYYRWNVTQSVIDAVDYYFMNQDSFPNYHSFYGDGRFNYFR